MLGSFSSCLFKGSQRTLLLIEAEAASPVGGGGERMQMGEACPGGLSCSPSCLRESPHKGSSLSFSALRGRGHRRGLCLPSGQGIKVTLPSLFQSVNSITSGRAQFSPGGVARKGGKRGLDAGKRSSTFCALGPLDHPQDGPCPRTVQRAKGHRPPVLSVKVESRASRESAWQWHPCLWCWASR